MDDLRIPLVRFLGPITAVSAVLTAVALAAGWWIGLPLAVIFVGAAFCWGMERADPAVAHPGHDGRRRWCAGCAAGCVECRERIDVGEPA